MKRRAGYAGWGLKQSHYRQMSGGPVERMSSNMFIWVRQPLSHKGENSPFPNLTGFPPSPP